MPNWEAKWERMSDDEARAHFERYVAGGPARIEELRAEAPVELDLTPESLEPLWEWAIPQFGLADATAPASGEPFWTEGLEWWRDDQRPDADTLLLVDRIAHYFGAVVLQNVPGARWVMEDDERVAGYRQPVIVPGRLNPLVATLAFAERTLFAPEFEEVIRDPDRLLSAYRTYEAQVT